MSRRTRTTISADGEAATRANRAPWHARLAAATRAAMLAAAVLLVAAGTARAELTFVPGSFRTTASSNQAGGHPNLTTTFRIEHVGDDFSGTLREIELDLPVGFVGSATAVDRCTVGRVTVGLSRQPPCPRSSIVGAVSIATWRHGLPPFFNPFDWHSAVYNVVPRAGSPAAFAFDAITTAVRLDVVVRPDGDYALRVSARNLSEAEPILYFDMTMFGVPADHQGPPVPGGPVYRFREDPNAINWAEFGGPNPGVERRPFLINPAVCDGRPLQATMRVRSWQEPTRWIGPLTDQVAPEIVGCDALRFEPSIDVTTDTRAAGAPVGLGVDLTVPQAQGGSALATPPLKDAIVTLPEGMAISPSGADGLGACTDAQLALRSAEPERCPDSAKLGTVTIDTPLLAEPLQGSAYLGSQRSRDPMSGEMIRLFLTAYGSGVRIKLRGAIQVDPVTGRVTARFLDNPQLPFSQLRLRLKGGPRAPLVNPSTCGTWDAHARMTSWAGQEETATDAIVVDQRCGARGFAPSFLAGVTNPAGGADSPFTLTFGRGDGDQMLHAISVDMPAGLLARIAELPELCPDAAAAAGTCGEGSRIGSVRVAAGPGTHPYRLPGRAYLTGPYKGAPYGMSIVVPAIAGPLDLGVVVVRAAVFIDRRTTAIRIVADPMPSILSGIPLQIREVTVTVDRPRFMVNPTSCREQRVGGEISSLTGALARVASRFQVGGCAALPFRPRMALRVGAEGRPPRRLRTVPFEVALRMDAGQAANRVVQVNLPRTLAARLEVINVNRSCSLEQYMADRCPSSIGTATAVTPLLRDPLVGTVYLVRNPARRLPDMMVRLRGQGDARLIEVDLVGFVTVTRALTLRTRFASVPDVPISLFRMRFVGGRGAPLAANRPLCQARFRRRTVARLAYVAQSGRRLARNQRIGVRGCRAGARARRGGGARAQRRNAARAQRRDGAGARAQR